jgi:hypothetical protein
MTDIAVMPVTVTTTVTVRKPREGWSLIFETYSGLVGS